MYPIPKYVFTFLIAASAVLADDIQVGSSTRSMIVHAPSGIATGRPLVISMHGMNQSASYQQSTTNWDAVADTAKFVVVYPSSVGTTWDIGGTSDLDFLKAIIMEMQKKYGIDLNRVYLSGFSMGGMMTYHAMNNISDQFAAFGPVSGYMSTDTKSSKPVPLLHVHGTSDGVVPYAPGNSGATGAWFPGALSIVEGWANWNDCNMTPTTTSPYPQGTSNSNSKKMFTGCKDGVEVGLISLDGKDHWHSNDPAGVYTTTELWSFFKKFSRTGATPAITSKTEFLLAEGVTKVLDLTSDMTGVTYSISGGVDQTRFAISGSTLSFAQSPLYGSPNDANQNNVYEVTIQVSKDGKSSTKDVKITILPPQGPYNGTRAIIPGVVEFENYDVGGNGYAYMDDSPGSQTGVDFRTTEDVDMEVCTDEGGGFNLGWATSGEWLEYSVNVTTAGKYTLEIHVACNGDGRTIGLEIGGKSIQSDIAIPNTAGWQNWQTITITDIDLEAGEQILRMTVGSTSYVNLNKMTFTLTSAVSAKPSMQWKSRNLAPHRLYLLNGAFVGVGSQN